MRRSTMLPSILALLAVLALPRAAAADDAATGDAGQDATAPDDAATGDGAASDGPSLACDGALCDTTNGSACSVAHAPGGGADGPDSAWLTILAALGALLAARVARRRAPSTPHAESTS